LRGLSSSSIARRDVHLHVRGRDRPVRGSGPHVRWNGDLLSQHRIDRPTLVLFCQRVGGGQVPVRQEVGREIQSPDPTLPVDCIPKRRCPRPRAPVRRCAHAVIPTKFPVVVQIQKRQIDIFVSRVRFQCTRQRRRARRTTVGRPSCVRIGSRPKLSVDRRHIQVAVRTATRRG